MKRLLSLVLMCCILLPLCASAESIKDQINAPDTYQAEYQSNSGRTRITVWDFFDANDPLTSLLTISAIDGTVIDRGYGY